MSSEEIELGNGVNEDGAESEVEEILEVLEKREASDGV